MCHSAPMNVASSSVWPILALSFFIFLGSLQAICTVRVEITSISYFCQKVQDLIVANNVLLASYLYLILQYVTPLCWLSGSRYASCLGYLQKLKPNLLLDIHLFDHVETLYEQVRHKALIQYTNPFISVDLNTMASAFKTSVAGLEKELAALIMENQIQVCNSLT